MHRFTLRQYAMYSRSNSFSSHFSSVAFIQMVMSIQNRNGSIASHAFAKSAANSVGAIAIAVYMGLRTHE